MNLLDNHPHRRDYQQLLSTAIEQSAPIWREHDGIVPFGVVMLSDQRIALIGGPDQLPNFGVGILNHICTTVLQDRSKYRCVAYVSLAMAKGKSLLVAELEHVNGIPLKAYCPLPEQEHWLVQEGTRRIWKKQSPSQSS